MGWLRDLMETGRPAVPSFGRLAALALTDPGWPSEFRIQERSLSTLFSKLDRGIELEWLRDRPEVQRVLASVMGRPWGDLKPHLVEPERTSDGRLLRLRDVRYARAIELTQEGLPPGIPLELQHPASWGSSLCYWHAPSGAGRSLLGAWLSARGLARHVRVHSADDLRDLPPRGALLIEVEDDRLQLSIDEPLESKLRLGQRPICWAGARTPVFARAAGDVVQSAAGSEAIPSAAGDLVQGAAASEAIQGAAASEAIPATAASEAVPATAGDVAQGAAANAVPPLHPIGSPPTSAYLTDLAGWLDERLGDEGHFDVERAESWMRRVVLPRGGARTFGETLGWLGLLDELPARSLSQRSIDELLELWLKRRLRDGDATDTPRKLTDHVYFELTELAARCLLARQPLGGARSLDDWAELLRGDRQEAPDPSWFGAALAEKSPLDRKELRRLTERLPPGAYQLVRALERADVLRPSQTSELHRLGPPFLTRWLAHRAETHALSRSSYAWGRALRAADPALELVPASLRSLLARDFAALSQLLDGWDSEETDEEALDRIAALEAGCLCAGLAELCGIRLPDELRRELVLESARFVVPFDDTLEPRFVPARSPEGIYDRDAWLLAWAALSEAHAALPVLLRPLEDPARASALLDAALRLAARTTAEAARSLERAPGADAEPLLSPVFQAGLFVLLDRLPHDSGSPHPSPVSRALDILLDSAPASAETRLARRRELDALVPLGGLRLLAAVASSRSIASARLHEALALLYADAPDFVPNQPTDFARDLWRALDTRALEARVLLGWWIDWSALLPHQFARWLDATACPLPSEAARHLPLSLLASLLERRGASALSESAWRIIGERAPQRLADLLAATVRRLADLVGAATRRADHELLLRMLPAARGAAQLPTIRSLPGAPTLLELPRESLDSLRRFLLTTSADRGDGSTEAALLLERLELGMRPIWSAQRH
ncbi:MAG TPA: hypothetical protein VLC09_15865 [Polyangiaceae bacterium]|nr:hypothetical protein [Polyangiaceae bacterium]